MTERTPQQGDGPEVWTLLQQEQTISVPVAQVTQEVLTQAENTFADLFQRWIIDTASL